MASGGPRDGAGRRKGSRNRRTREVLEALVVSHCTPLVYMLRIINDPAAETERRDRMALAAAPYLHSKLTGIGWLPTEGLWGDDEDEPTDRGAARMVALLMNGGGAKLD